MANDTIQLPETDAEISALVAEIASGLNAIAKKEEEKLAKAAPADESEPAESASAPPADEGSAPPPDASASPEAPPPDASASPEGPPPGGPEGAPEGSEAGPSVEELTQLYSQLPDEQLEAHFVAIQQAVASRSGGEGAEAGGPPPGPDASAGGPPPGPDASAGGPPPAPPAGPPPGGPAGGPPPEEGPAKMALSEANTKIENLEKAVLTLTQALDKVTMTPIRKSVTRYENGIAYIPHQGPVVVEQKPLKKSVREMTKAEITARLTEVASNPKLEKSDRDLINGYYTKSVSIDKLDKFFQ